MTRFAILADRTLLPSQRAAIALARPVPGHAHRASVARHEADLETAYAHLTRPEAQVDEPCALTGITPVSQHTLASRAADANGQAAANRSALAGRHAEVWADQRANRRLINLYEDGDPA